MNSNPQTSSFFNLQNKQDTQGTGQKFFTGGQQNSQPGMNGGQSQFGVNNAPPNQKTFFSGTGSANTTAQPTNFMNPQTGGKDLFNTQNKPQTGGGTTQPQSFFESQNSNYTSAQSAFSFKGPNAMNQTNTVNQPGNPFPTSNSAATADASNINKNQKYEEWEMNQACHILQNFSSLSDNQSPNAIYKVLVFNPKKYVTLLEISRAHSGVFKKPDLQL